MRMLLSGGIFCEAIARQRGTRLHQIGGWALEDGVMAGAGPKVDDPVGVRHDRLVIVDDEHRFPGVHQSVEQPEKLLNVGQVQARRGLVDSPLSANWAASFSR